MNEEWNDLSLQPANLTDPPGEAYATPKRLWQGIPGIERTAGGCLWAAWYSGDKQEGPENYVVLVRSKDDGQSWSQPLLVVDPPGKVRAYDPCLWIDPLGRLWFFWAQSYNWFDGRCGVWASVTTEPDAERPAWSAPRRLANGIMMNKPTVLSNGEWLMPAAVWERSGPRYDAVRRGDMAAERFSNVYVSPDQGASWRLRGGADMPGRSYDEHMVAERNDGGLAMFIRATQGYGQSHSTDGGRTWSPGTMSRFTGPDTRCFVRRLHSGQWLMIYHDAPKARERLSAWLSPDEGATWAGPLLLDERDKVSYPDATQAADGRIYAIYDRDRHGAGEILMAVFREEDVRAGRLVSGDARLAVLVDRLSPGPGG
jgi:hypothetical protein